MRVDDKLAKINQRNKEVNLAPKEDERSAASFLHPDLDPFSRRKTKPAKAIVFDYDKPNNGQTPGQNQTEKKEVKDSTGGATQKENKDGKDKKAPIEKKMLVEKLVAPKPESILKNAHAFDIELTDTPTADKAMKQKKTEEKPVEPVKRRTLSVEDYYKRREGLMERQ